MHTPRTGSTSWSYQDLRSGTHSRMERTAGPSLACRIIVNGSMFPAMDFPIDAELEPHGNRIYASATPDEVERTTGYDRSQGLQRPAIRGKERPGRAPVRDSPATTKSNRLPPAGQRTHAGREKSRGLELTVTRSRDGLSAPGSSRTCRCSRAEGGCPLWGEAASWARR